jgi:hypothetical protein
VRDLWSVGQAAEYWDVSMSRARAILASRKIKRVSGYPVGEIMAVRLQQGARTDLARHHGPDGTARGRRMNPEPRPDSNNEPPAEEP